MHRKETILDGVMEGLKFRAAGKIGAGFYSECGGLCERENVIVALVDVADGPAIGDHVTAEAPLIAKKAEEQMIGAGGLVENGIVGAHNGIGVAIDDGGAEGGRVGVIEIVERDGNVEAMAKSFWAAVNGVMLGSRNSLEIVRIVALQASDEGYAEARGEEGIFAVSFHNEDRGRC